MVFNATFNYISAILWRSVSLVEESGVPGEIHRPVASHWQTLSLTNLMLYRVYLVSAVFELTTLVVIALIAQVVIKYYKCFYYFLCNSIVSIVKPIYHIDNLPYRQFSSHENILFHDSITKLLLIYKRQQSAIGTNK